MDIQRLKDAGIDYEAGLKRFLNDPRLYGTVLSAFLKENMEERARAAYQERDMKLLLSVVHEAKGSSGNAGLTIVYDAASALVLLLRSEAYTSAELDEKYNSFMAVYSKVREAIKSSMEG